MLTLCICGAVLGSLLEFSPSKNLLRGLWSIVSWCRFRSTYDSVRTTFKW
jgi:hypothetical protein